MLKAKAMTSSLFLVAAVLCSSISHALVEPDVVQSVNGVLETTLTLELGTYSFRDPNNGQTTTITAPLFNGTLPGPTLLVRPGDLIQLTFENRLPATNVPYRHNEYSAPTETNIHFHGLFVSGELPSDDATLVLTPGMSFTYTTQLPATHSPGTHWYHPHRHGSTALQLAGGAAGALIVQDDATVPAAVSEAPTHICVLQEYNPREAAEVIDIAQASDIVFTSSSTSDNRVILVNGEVAPSIPMATNVWTRLRWINAGWEGDAYNLSVDGSCELALLAKDGIFVRDAPRTISRILIFIGGRADVMVRCPNAGRVNVRNIQDDSRQGLSSTLVATLQVAEDTSSGTTELEPWDVVYPEYLQDLRTTPPSNGCSCSTRLDDNAVNGLKFEYDRLLHQSYLGAVVERNIRADRHPYHQHVYPYQLIAGIDTDAGVGEYYKVGDWHDTFDGNAIVRYQPQEFEGKVMLHCHKLTHEDQGMMAMEQVVSGNGTCACNIGTFLVPSAPTMSTPNPTASPPTVTMATTIAPSGKNTTREPTAAPSSTPSTSVPTVFPMTMAPARTTATTEMPLDNDMNTTPTEGPTTPSTEPTAGSISPSSLSIISSSASKNTHTHTVSSSPTTLIAASSASTLAVVLQALIALAVPLLL